MRALKNFRVVVRYDNSESHIYFDTYDRAVEYIETLSCEAIESLIFVLCRVDMDTFRYKKYPYHGEVY